MTPDKYYQLHNAMMTWVTESNRLRDIINGVNSVTETSKLIVVQSRRVVVALEELEAKARKIMEEM